MRLIAHTLLSKAWHSDAILKLTRLVRIKHFADGKELTVRARDVSVKNYSRQGYYVNTFLQLRLFDRS